MSNPFMGIKCIRKIEVIIHQISILISSRILFNVDRNPK